MIRKEDKTAVKKRFIGEQSAPLFLYLRKKHLLSPRKFINRAA